MPVLDFDAFEAWVRDRSRGCMEQSEIDELCKSGFDIDGEWYGFVNPSVQAQWEAWQAALESRRQIHIKDRVFAERIKSEAMSGDNEMDHGSADDLLCELLASIGCSESVAAFQAVGKWYA